MGKAILVVALVGAAFAGGAVVNNGPALAKVQALIQGAPAARPGAPASAPPAPPADEPESPGGEPATDIPATPPPALALDTPGGLEPPALPPPRRAAPPKTDAELVKADGSPSSSEADAEPEPEPLNAKALGLDAQASKVEPPARPSPKSRAAAPEPSAAPHPGGWDDLRRRMKALGVARYWCEGEPGGPARFRCVIPTAGGRAVSQHFEAEGEDDLQAAEATLRRVALWKSTEQP